jgi:hypothetical protein
MLLMLLMLLMLPMPLVAVLLLRRDHLARQAGARRAAAGRLLDLEEELAERYGFGRGCRRAAAAAFLLLLLLLLLLLRLVERVVAGSIIFLSLVQLQDDALTPPALRRGEAALEDGGGRADADRDDCSARRKVISPYHHP